jgi:N-acylethanolamine-hydrolysing acid amidase
MEGTVIERDPSSVHAQYSLDEKTWFLVQTNFDRDQPDLDNRRTAAENRINAIGPKITIQ